MFKTSFLFKHSHFKNNIRITQRFLHNNGISIALSIVLLLQSFQGRKEKCFIIWNSNLNCKKMPKHNVLLDSNVWYFISLSFLLHKCQISLEKKRKNMGMFEKIERPLEWAFYFQKTFHKRKGKNMLGIMPYRIQIHYKNPDKKV
jgi:hypothetical protein